MSQCKECQADLPENARFCHQCGAAVATEPVVPAQVDPATELDFVRPAIAGGVFLGLLSSLPVLQAGNCLCCMWVIGGGSIATYQLSRQQHGRRLGLGDGAFAGVLSGLFGAIIATVVSIPIKLISARFLQSQQQSIEEMFRNMPEIEGPMRDILMRMLSPEVSALTVLATFLSNLIFFALFAMVGGILTVAVLNKKGGDLQQPPPRQTSGF